jgi:uncharacterized membrane protein
MKMFKKLFWILGFIPAIIGLYSLINIKESFHSSIMNLNADFLGNLLSSFILVGLSAILVPVLIVISNHIRRKDQLKNENGTDKNK